MLRIGLRLVPLAAVLIPFLWCFGPVLLTPGNFTHRDASRFYLPLFEWTSAQWQHGRMPLWNPQEDCGTSVVGDTTSSVWYPGKLVFLLPFSFGFNYKLYTSIHLLLAAATSFLLARRWRATSQAAAICAVSYAFGGYVLFQYANVAFLVSAAWLPASIVAIDLMIRRRRPQWAVVFGMTMALMTLGGDPQAAYHCGLIATLYAMLLAIKRRRRRRRRPRAARKRDAAGVDPPPRWLRFARWRPSLLGLAAFTAAAMAAVQVLPSLQRNGQSERSTYHVPRNVYQIPRLLLQTDTGQLDDRGAASLIVRGVFGSPEPGTHHRDIYEFSIGPWRLFELFFPNVSGKPFPENRRLPVDPAYGAWAPSLYAGILPLLLGLSALTMRCRSTRMQWMGWCVALAIVGSFGWYGPGWLLRTASANEPSIGEPVGGLYWMMVTLLPGYHQFRYPAKLFLFASLGLSLFAARGWDRMCVDPNRIVRTLRCSAFIAGACLIASLLGRPMLSSWLAKSPPNLTFGPLDASGALAVVHFSLLQTMLVCGVCWWLCRRLTSNANDQIARIALLLTTSVELALAQAWMIPLAPQDVWDGGAWAEKEIKSHVADDDASFRVYRSRDLLPRHWMTTGSPDREVEALRWDRDTLRPRTHLSGSLSLLESTNSIMPDDFNAVIGCAREFTTAQHGDSLHPHLLDALGVRYIVQANRAELDADSIRLGREKLAALPAAALWFNPSHFGRAWIVHRIEWLPEAESSDPWFTDALTQHVLFPDGKARDLRTQAAVEVETPPEARSLSEWALPTEESCRLVASDPQRLEIEAALTQPGLVVLSDYYDPNWTAEIVERSTKARIRTDVLRTNRIMRGLFLPAGQFKIIYRYKPVLLWQGAFVSSLAWLGGLFLLAWTAASFGRR